MRDIIAQYTLPTSKILIVGCGSSRMPEEMHEDGYQQITCVDLSYSAIKLQQDEYKDKYQNLTFKQMDVRNIGFPDGHFDVVIDKALLDAMVCGGGANGNVQLMLSEIHRVLNPTGTYICISHGKEKQRKKYLKNVKKYNWVRKKYSI